MNRPCSERKAGTDDDDSDKRASIHEEGNQQEPLFQRPGPACSKRKSLGANVNNQPKSPLLRSGATSSSRSPSPVQEPADNEPAYSSRNAQNISQSTAVEENDSSQPVLPPSTSGPSLSTTDAATNQVKQSSQISRRGSKIGMKDENQFITLVRKFPNLYNTTDHTKKGKVKKIDSWRAASKEFGAATVKDCQDKWRSICERYCRAKKQLTDEGHVTDKIMQFINNLNFLSYHKRTGSKLSKLSIRASTKRTQSKVVSGSDLKATFSEIQNNGPKPDQAFADDIAAALERFSPEQKYVLKAKFWQVLAEFGNRFQNITKIKNIFSFKLTQAYYKVYCDICHECYDCTIAIRGYICNSA